MCNVLNGWEVSGNRNGTLSDGNRQTLITRKLDKKSTGPKKGSGSFIRHRHDTPHEGVVRSQPPCAPSHRLRILQESPCWMVTIGTDDALGGDSSGNPAIERFLATQKIHSTSRSPHQITQLGHGEPAELLCEVSPSAIQSFF